MTDTLWSDVSEFQRPVNNQYPYSILEFRSNDGTYLDHNFSQNFAWAKAAVPVGKLALYIVYYFYRPGSGGARVLMNRVGKPDSHMVAMIDVESAGGQITGDHSAEINQEFGELAAWLGSDKRVFGYGNTSDLNSIWPNKPAGVKFKIDIAAYGSNPSYPGKFAHQFMDNANTPPFGPSDLNSADGMRLSDLQTMFGMSPNVSPPAKPTQVTADGNVSWRQLAHQYGTSVQRSVWYTARESGSSSGSGFTQPREAAYVSVGNWDARLAAGMGIWVGP
jgi:hypothetical protein